MPFHWSKHHSNIVPPMTREQPAVLTEQREAESYMGGDGEERGSAQGGIEVEEKSGVGFGLRLQTQIEIPQHVQPVVDPCSASSVSADALSAASVSFGPVYTSFNLKNCFYYVGKITAERKGKRYQVNFILYFEK